MIAKLMKPQEQIRNLKKICNTYSVPYDLLDWKALIDNTLTYEENKKQILPLIETLAESQDSNDKKQTDFKTRKKTIKQEKEEQDRGELEQIKKEEEHTKKELDKAIDKIVKDTPRLEKYFEPLVRYLTAVIKSDGYLNSLFCYSLGGLGKTTVVLTTLKNLKADFVYVSNYTTIVELVNFLHENKDKKIIVMDDIEEIWRLGAKVINLLKGALWGIGKENKRLITYLTTSKLMKAPRQFEFSGKMIFLLNKMPNEEDVLVKALLSRSLVYKLDFTYREILKMLAEFIKIPYKKLTLEERKNIFVYLKANVDDTTIDLNFRTIIKMYDLYITDRKNWKDMTKEILNKDEKICLLKQLLKECSTIGEAQKKWSEKTGKHRATFFRIKNRIVA